MERVVNVIPGIELLYNIKRILTSLEIPRVMWSSFVMVGEHIEIISMEAG